MNVLQDRKGQNPIYGNTAGNEHDKPVQPQRYSGKARKRTFRLTRSKYFPIFEIHLVFYQRQFFFDFGFACKKTPYILTVSFF
jgi:hypothetical protein